MPEGWRWDETLFRGSARYYERGRLPYPEELAAALAGGMKLDGRGRLIDVGCGPGIIALRLAHLFEEVVGLDADADMVTEAERRSAELGILNARWVRALAEELPAGLGVFRVATFAQSFHWMDRDRVAAAVFDMLETGGAFVQVSAEEGSEPEPDQSLYPFPPHARIRELRIRYLGPVRRAGQGVLLHGTPDGEDAVVRRAGFEQMEVIPLGGREVVVWTVEDVVAAYYSSSGTAPHLFGDRLPEFEAELRHVLADASPSGLFAVRTGDTELRVWRKPAH
jgi:SAM-dependent methyltransferase